MPLSLPGLGTGETKKKTDSCQIFPCRRFQKIHWESWIFQGLIFLKVWTRIMLLGPLEDEVDPLIEAAGAAGPAGDNGGGGQLLLEAPGAAGENGAEPGAANREGWLGGPGVEDQHYWPREFEMVRAGGESAMAPSTHSTAQHTTHALQSWRWWSWYRDIDARSSLSKGLGALAGLAHLRVRRILRQIIIPIIYRCAQHLSTGHHFHPPTLRQC